MEDNAEEKSREQKLIVCSG